MSEVEQPAVEPDEVPVAPKVDPETLVLRGQPRRAIRFRRGVIIGAAALASVSIVATTWVALRPGSFHLVNQNDDRSDPGKAQLDTLSALPTSYGEAPRLGPALPGDLGRPILDHQRAMANTPLATAPIATTPAVGPVDQSAAMERERQLTDLRAARQSGLMFRPSSGGVDAAPVSGQPAAAVAPADKPQAALDPDHDPNAQGHKAEFVAATDRGGDANPHVLRVPPSPNMLSAGSVIAASLITGLRSDLPGLVTAQVTERVYDSATGRTLLIPQGARLIGSYDSVVAFGQRRALIVWQRIILPDGSSLALDNVPATDPSGYAGLADKVDAHTWSLLKGVAISTLLGVGSSLTFTGESDLVQAIRESTQQNVSRAGDQLTSRNLQVQPTITVRPGAPVRLVVHRDLILRPWRDPGA
jgi:type IV secretory pathway VirB10-like protein